MYSLKLFLFCSLLFLLGCSLPKVVKPKPNIIFLLADDMGYGDVNFIGNATETPNLNRLATDGVFFNNFYSAAPNCSPSRVGLLTGKAPEKTGMYSYRPANHPMHLPDEESTIAEFLKTKGYQTAHFGKWGMGSNPSVFGYDVSDGPTKNKDGNFDNNRSQWKHVFKKDPKNIFSLTDRAIEFIDSIKEEEKPFYLQISHYAVHSNVESKEKSYASLKDKPIGAQQKDLGFAAMTFDLDEGLGLLLNKIKELEIEDNTYIIYMSDNGSVPNIPGAKKYEKSYNFPLSRGKWDAYEGGVRVPLIIAGPGIKNDTESATPVSGSDLLPTIIDLAGNKTIALTEIDGGSFAPILLNENNKKIKRAVDGIFFHVPYKNGIALKRPHSAVRKGDYKLIKFQDDKSILLFNLVKDKMEQLNLATQKPEKVKELEKILDNYLTEVNAPKWQDGITWKNTPLKEINSNY